MVCLALGLICAGAFWSTRGTKPEVQKPAESELNPVAVAPDSPPSQSPVTASTTAAHDAKTGSLEPPPQTRPEPSPLTRQLVSGLTTFDASAGPMSPEQAALWKQNLDTLVKQGAAGVPGIMEYLEKHTDFVFDSATAQALGYPSARSAMFDALAQIGGPEGVNGMLSVLKTTADPREIAWLIQLLEKVEPGVHGPSAVAAAREALTMAAAGNLPDRDVAPLFEVFQFYGDPSTVSELEKSAGKWGYYATAALANLPDNAGLPSLLKMADPATGSINRTIALQMVAQLAGGSPEAREFLLNQVKTGQIPERLWPYLKSPLSGEQYYPVDSVITQYPSLPSLSELKRTRIPYGNQNLYTLPAHGSMSLEGINQQIALVNELIAVSADPAATRTLEQAKATLNRRLARTTKSSTASGSDGMVPEG